MELSLEVACFNYCGREFAAQLAAEQGAGTDRLIRCPVRHALYVLTPEERVRQALIWFLVEGASNEGGWRERLRFEVEQRSLDIGAFLAREVADDRFFFNIPVFIVETKRQERELTGDLQIEEQLKTYMVRERCRAGLIFNARQAVWFSLHGEFAQGGWTKNCLTDLSQVEELIHEATADATVKALDYRSAFTLAADGDFDSLFRLVSLIGSDYWLTFVLSIRSRGKVSSVQAFGIRTLADGTLIYRTRGVVSRKPQQLTRQDFHFLVAVLTV